MTNHDEFAAHIHEVYRAISNAVENNDPESFAALYTEDGALMTPDGAVISGRAAIGAAFTRWTAAGWIGQHAELVELKIGDQVISEEGRSVGTFRTADETTVTRNNYLITHLLQEDGSWLMHRDIWTTVQDNPTAGSY